ncbi:MAG: flagellar export chaperone FlgN [Phycisphaerales bacterium]|nr:flagellar export chaperone FlgN [Phycisphaerales bacterium]
MTDTQQDNPNWIAELIQLLESQDAIVRELEAMGPRQASCIASGQVDDLLTILSRRQELVEALLPTQTALATRTREFQARISEVTEADRERVDGLMESVDRGMQAILASDEADRSRLQVQRDSVRSGLAELDTGRRALQGYQATPQIGGTQRFADAHG